MIVDSGHSLTLESVASLPWQDRIGHQREWLWRGWPIRYSVMLPEYPSSKPPLILLHGFGAAIEHWRQNIPVLARDRPVYALDLLGFGGSKKADTSYSTYLWASQIYHFWQAVLQEPVVIVGNSIGSLVGLTAAGEYPDMVKGLVMLSLPDVSLRQAALPPAVQPLITRLENAIAAPWLLKRIFRVVRRPSVIQKWAGIAYQNRGCVNPELVEIISRPPLDEGADQTFCRLAESVRSPSFAPPAHQVLPLLTIPMLLIWGEQDRMVPPLLADRLANLNPRHIELQRWENAGHCPQDECPERFNKALQDWLSHHFSDSFADADRPGVG